MVRDPEAPQEAPKFMGHGICNVHNKSAPLSNGSGGATDEGSRIGAAIIQLYRTQNFDPKELRGIGIHVQKLERPKAVNDRPQGQGVLNFALKPAQTANEPSRRSGPDNASLLVDLTGETSSSPAYVRIAPPQSSAVVISSDINENLPKTPQKQKSAGSGSRHRSNDPAPVENDDDDDDLSAHGFAVIEDDEIQSLGSSPATPRGDLRRSVLRSGGHRPSTPNKTRPSRTSKSPSKTVNPFTLARSPHRSESTTRQHTPTTNESFDLTIAPCKRPSIRIGSAEPKQDVDSILDGISHWMDRSSQRPPNGKEVKVLCKYLKRCLDSQTASLGGVQDATRVLGWWRKICQRKWGSDSGNLIGEQWRASLHDVEAELDEIAIRRFGGPLYQM